QEPGRGPRRGDQRGQPAGPWYADAIRAPRCGAMRGRPVPLRGLEPQRELVGGRIVLRTTGRVCLRRATSLKPARSNIRLAPNHMKSEWLAWVLSTGYASRSVAPFERA